MNLTMPNLRSALSEIYFGSTDERVKKYILPMSGNWLIPTALNDETISTWIGYQIVKIAPKSTDVQRGAYLLKDCDMTVRLIALGEQAEPVITSVLFWDERLDVQNIFERYLGKLQYAPRNITTSIYSQEGFNSELCWLTDFHLICYYGLDTEAGNIEGFKLVGSGVLRNLKE